MQENFNKAMDFIINAEGGYNNDPHDKGGETKFGISQKAFPNLKIVEITEEQAKSIYKVNYWNPCKCDILPSLFDIAVFDSAINQGPKKAIMLLQRALNIKDDGIIGDETLNACKHAGEAELRKFLLYRLWEYAHLDDFDRYGKGWFNRLIKLSGTI